MQGMRCGAYHIGERDWRETGTTFPFFFPFFFLQPIDGTPAVLNNDRYDLHTTKTWLAHSGRLFGYIANSLFL